MSTFLTPCFSPVQIYGQEADDVIGSLTKIIGERGDFSCIVSNDKDFQQLLEGENIKLLKPCWNKSSGRWTLFTENDFQTMHDHVIYWKAAIEE